MNLQGPYTQQQRSSPFESLQRFFCLSLSVAAHTTLWPRLVLDPAATLVVEARLSLNLSSLTLEQVAV